MNIFWNTDVCNLPVLNYILGIIITASIGGWVVFKWYYELRLRRLNKKLKKENKIIKSENNELEFKRTTLQNANNELSAKNDELEYEIFMRRLNDKRLSALFEKTKQNLLNSYNQCHNKQAEYSGIKNSGVECPSINYTDKEVEFVANITSCLDELQKEITKK